MEFRQFEVFTAVAETRSFSKAANRLYLSQSTVSAHIKNLEKELQKTLIVRSTKKMQLTEDGETFLFYARRMMDTRDAALHAISSPTNAYLHMGASTIPSAYLFPDLLSGFLRLYPQVYCDIEQADSSAIENKIMDGSLELGLIGRKADPHKCVSIPFCQDDLVIITPATPYYESLLNDKKTTLSSILKEPLIIRESGSGTKEAADSLLSSANISSQELHVIIQNNDPEAIKAMVVRGMGISIFSKLAVGSLLEQGLVLPYPLSGPTKRTFYIIHRKDQAPKLILKKFIEYAKNYYKQC